MAPNTLATLLTQYLATRQATAFDWPSANCCHFAAGWVAHATGKDPMSGLPVTPDATSARRLVRKLGGLALAWSRQLGSSPIHPSMARLGDVVMMPVDAPEPIAGAAMGVCCGRTAVFLSEAGLAHVPMSRCTRAWRLAC